MTERTLLLRFAHEGRFVMLGTDFPSARVFDTATSRLSCVVELPARSRGSLAALSLTAVALGTDATGSSTSDRTGGRADGEDGRVTNMSVSGTTFAVVGLSNGTALIHDVTKDVLVGHVAVSETQHALVSMCVCDGFLFCLAANSTLYVVNLASVAGAHGGPAVVLKARTQPEASAIAVLREDGDAMATAGAAQRVFRVLLAGPSHALVRVQLACGDAGSTASTGAGAGVGPRSHSVAERVLTFSSQGTRVDYAWLGPVKANASADADADADTTTTTSAVAVAALTACADEGVIRVWDMNTDAATPARCRRTLLCGQRIANVSVLDRSKSRAGTSRGAVYVLATTFTGTVLVWNLGDQLLPRMGETAPLVPAAAFFSAAPNARMLYAVLCEGHAEDAALAPASVPSALADPGLQLLLLRGKLATPTFEVAGAQALLMEQERRLGRGGLPAAPAANSDAAMNTTTQVSRAKQLRRMRKTASALGLGISPSLILVEVPALEGAGLAEAGRGNTSGVADAATNAFQVMDTVWARQRHGLATRALMTSTEAFAAAHAHRAASMAELPSSLLTLEQRLRALSTGVRQRASRRALAADDEAESEAVEDEDTAAVGVYPSLGLATVPIYQALHANDVSTVMELLSIAARSTAGMRATVLSLQLPYALQLVQIISERLGITSAKATVGVGAAVVGGSGGLAEVSSRSPLLLWLDTLLHYRGMEMYSAQLDSGDGSGNEAGKLAEAQAAGAPVVASPPKVFLAPILHQYQRMCANYDKLASLHGRLSIFNAVRPSERNQFVNRPRKMLASNRELASATPAALSGKLNAAHTVQDNDILFPAMFTELRTRAGPHVVRVRSKLAREKQRHRLATTDRALLKKARQMAKQAARNGTKSDKDNDDESMDEDAAMAAALGGTAAEEDIDLETLEALGLGSSDDDDDDDDSGDDSGSDRDAHEDGALTSSEGASDTEDHRGRPVKKSRKDRATRGATAEVLADAPSSLEGDDDDDEDVDAELDSSDAGADFTRESDDDVDSQLLDASGDDDSEGSSSDDDEDEEDSDASADRAGAHAASHPHSDDDDDGSAEDDGMGEDMAHMLKQMDTADEDATREARKSKRVRTD